MAVASAVTASSAPESTTDVGPLTAAIAIVAETSSGNSASLPVTSGSGARTAIIAPSEGSAAINRPRAATRRTASARENTPAMCAAASSPIECPTR